MSARTIAPKSWASFQHYKNKRPAWIKLHRELLHDTTFARLPVEAKALAPMLWLLACEGEGGALEADIEELAFRLRWPQKEVAKGLPPLIEAGYFVVIDDGESESRQPLEDAPQDSSEPLRSEEKRRDREEKETEKSTARARGSGGKPPPKPDDVSAEVWADWLTTRKAKRAAVTATAMARIRKQAEAAGMSLEDALSMAMARGWQGFQADWTRNGKGGVSRRAVNHVDHTDGTGKTVRSL